MIDACIHHNVPIANIVVCERNKDETKLLIGCENGTLRGVARISLKGGLSIEKECTRMARIRAH